MPTEGEVRSLVGPLESGLGLRRIANRAGLTVSVLPNGAVFAIEHETAGRRVLINQVLGSPVHGGIGRVMLRLGPPDPRCIEIMGPTAAVAVTVGEDRIVWSGATDGIRYRTTLCLHPTAPLWHWQIAVTPDRDCAADVILVQDIGLGARSFLMTNEAYASQYTDHHVARHFELGPVLMSRQNLAQAGRHPWIAHGCLDGTVGFATDALQLFGPAFREAATVALPFGTDLPSTRLQHEAACAIIQSAAFRLEAGETGTRNFFAMYDPDHPGPSTDRDLVRVARALEPMPEAKRFQPSVEAGRTTRSLLQDAAPVLAETLDPGAIAAHWPERRHEEVKDGALLSFFTPDGPHNRHVVLAEKERRVPRRHGTLLRSGTSMLPDDATLCATAWMHGVFGAQLTIGNTSFHKLFSVSRDPYNITRASGLRMLVEIDGAWRLLATPSAFEMGLSDCVWHYRVGRRAIAVRAIASGAHAAMRWRIGVEGPPCRFLVFAHVVLGEREYEQAGRIEIDTARKRIAFRPDPDSLFGRHYPEAAYHLVTATPGEIEAVGDDALLSADGESRGAAMVALRTGATAAFEFAVVGSMTDASAGRELAETYAAGVADEAMLAPAARYWSEVSHDLRVRGEGPGADDLAAIETAFPWFAHNAIMHLTVPHGLEQYSGAAWGVRDVCQGPVEFLLALEHDAPVKDILRLVFGEQSESRGDWPQWFMLPPYTHIRDPHAHGDVIVWPLKALCDYIEATGDLHVLDEPVAWRRDDMTASRNLAPVSVHADSLIAAAKARFIPGTHLIRYGEGDWNDSLQPADPGLRDRMVSSWTVALLFQQLGRYAEVLRRAGREAGADELSALASAMAADFRRHLMRDGVVAGYAIFGEDGGAPELLLHPDDQRTGLRYSLLPMTRGIIAGLFTADEAARHLGLIREHLLAPDGARLMDRPVAYSGGVETTFRRAESAAFFGREIGLMYVHAHLRYAEAMAALGEADALWDALAVVNPIAVTERVANATLRQRNAFFSSSDAAFPDRATAGAEWARVQAGQVPVDGGWRIYSSGPGLFANMLLRHALGIRRLYGTRIEAPLLPRALGWVTVDLNLDGRGDAPDRPSA